MAVAEWDERRARFRLRDLDGKHLCGGSRAGAQARPPSPGPSRPSPPGLVGSFGGPRAVAIGGVPPFREAPVPVPVPAAGPRPGRALGPAWRAVSASFPASSASLEIGPARPPSAASLVSLASAASAPPRPPPAPRPPASRLPSRARVGSPRPARDASRPRVQGLGLGLRPRPASPAQAGPEAAAQRRLAAAVAALGGGPRPGTASAAPSTFPSSPP
eukprot:tig00000455_g1050.t1